MNRMIPSLVAGGVILVFAGHALARHVTHPVTPKNINEQPFAFAVQIKDVGDLKEIEIVVKQKPGRRGPIPSATGNARIAPCGDKKAESPTMTRVETDSEQKYTFRVSPADVNRTSFTFTETPQDPMIPFPSPGDYWVFALTDFVGSEKK